MVRSPGIRWQNPAERTTADEGGPDGSHQNRRGLSGRNGRPLRPPALLMPSPWASKPARVRDPTFAVPFTRLPGHTGAGTRAEAADAFMFCRRAVKSEIVLVVTVATGRASRPVAAVFETITTLSM